MEVTTPKPVKKETKLRILKKNLAKVKLQSNYSDKKASLDDKEKFAQTITKIKSRNNNLVQRTEAPPIWSEILNQNEGSIELSENRIITRIKKLPPYLPVSSFKRDIIRPKSNWSNLLPNELSNKRNSKLRISLRGSLHSDITSKLRTNSVWGKIQSRSRMSISEKTQTILNDKRVASKDSRKKWKSRISLGNKRSFLSSKYKLNKDHLNFRDSSTKFWRPFLEDYVS